MKKLFAWALFLVLMVAPLASFAEPSTDYADETVYALLDALGEQESVIVVTRFDTPEDGTYVRDGAYDRVWALTQDVQPTIDDGIIAWTLPADPEGFYYAGVLSDAALPFVVDIGYTLDGVAILPDALAGQSGHVEIALSVTSNPDVSAVFRQRYMAQIQLPLSQDRCSAIDAPGATGSLVGATRTLTYTILPGQDAEYRIAFDALDFEMDGITVACVPMDLAGMLGVDLSELTGQIDPMTEGAKQLADGGQQLSEGIAELAEGIATLAGQMGMLTTGVTTLQSGVSKLAEGVAGLPEQLSQLSGASETLTGGATQYIQGAQDVFSGTGALAEGAYSLAQGGAELSAGLEAMEAGLAPLMTTLPKAQQDALATQLAALKQAMGEYTQGVTTLAEQATTLAGGAETLGESTDALLDGLTAQHEGIVALQSALSPLASQTSILSVGTATLSSGVQQAVDALASINEATAALPEQVKALADGQAALSDGLSGAVAALGDLPLLDADEAVLHSFVGADDSPVQSVQFVLMTSPIRMPAEERVPANNDTSSSFWDRLVDLFR